MSGAFLWAFAEEERRRNVLKYNRRVMRDASNPLALPHNEFVAQFRLTKDAFDELYREVIPLLRTRKRKTMIRDELKVLAALSFFSRGSYQRGVANSYLHNMCQTALCCCLDEVTNAMNTETVLKKYIKFPTQRDRRENIMAEMGDEMDPCECLWNHELAMRRLITLLRQGQSYCTDSECLEEIPGLSRPESAGNSFLVMFLMMAMAVAMYMMRPRRNQIQDAAKPMPNFHDDNGAPPTPPRL